MKHRNFTYRAKVKRVIDGDTIECVISMGFYMHTQQHIRLAEIDTPELRSSDSTERLKAHKAKKYLESLLQSNNNQIMLCIASRGKYGRWIGKIYIGEDFDIYVNKLLVTNGHAIWRSY